jgi:IS605 OrfB family transposase
MVAVDEPEDSARLFEVLIQLVQVLPAVWSGPDPEVAAVQDDAWFLFGQQIRKVLYDASGPALVAVPVSSNDNLRRCWWAASGGYPALHKLTTRLVRENQTVVIEDLTVRNMVKNHTLARAISDAAWREMRTMLEYKCAWYGRELVVIDRWFPSSKLCGACGTIAAKLPLHVRAWTCPCGAVHDRDVNAVRNILAAGLAASACGADVRPKRRKPGGQSAVKQEPRRATAGIPAL